MGLFWFVLLVTLQLLLLSALADRNLSPKAEITSNEGEVGLLLAFKEFCVKSDPNGILLDWKATSSTPCSWRSVSCSLDGLVTALNLSNAGLIGSLHLPQLTALPALNHLNLHGNSFSSGDLSISAANANANASRSSSSCALETLDLSNNNLSDPLPYKSFFLSCDRLSYVNLSGNSIPGGTLHLGPSLLQLDLSRNRISDSAMLSYTLSNCHHLNLLNFSDNKISGQLSFTLRSCKSLSTLDLSYNLLSGFIPSSFVADAPPFLKYLDLSYNNFSAIFSALDFGGCSNLTWLKLSRAALYGEEFPASLKNCLFLETLDLSQNVLQSKIPSSLATFRNLKQLSLAHNNFYGKIPPELGQLCGTLQELDFSKNLLSGELPLTFSSCSSLLTLDLGSNQLSGNFLSTVISNLRSLRFLYLQFNNISGPVPLSLTNCTQLQVLDLSSNAFIGTIPYGFCSSPVPSALEKILVSNNFLSGMVPLELGKCKKLRTIDLSFNNLIGPIPKEIWSLPNLSELIMWANNLSGEIPEGICIMGGNLEMLILNNNHIEGTLPQSIANCTNMSWISLSNNQLIGEIPQGIGNLVNLAILQMGNNSLTGQIPPELGNCRSLIWLDLNSNDLSGSIPSELADQAGQVLPGSSVSKKPFAFLRNEGGTTCRGVGGLVEFAGIRSERLERFLLVHSCSSTRIYKGMTISTFKSNGSMIFLDLSYNSLSGTIPAKLGALNYLQILDLGHNRLNGNIPDSFGELRALGVLDLSHNYLEGFVPGSLQTLSFLSDLDVSNNNLIGDIPSGGQLTTFPASRYENNSGLCGIPLPLCGSQHHSAGHNSQGRKQSIAGEQWKSVLMGYGCGFIFGTSMGYIILFSNWKARWLLKWLYL